MKPNTKNNESPEVKAFKAAKRAYAKRWYLANRMYKKTYARFYRRAIDDKCNFEQRGAANTALDEIIRDRRMQVSKGRWLDERTGGVYTGIKARK